MKNFRLYGQEPFRIAVIHGGPGAAGEMAPVARELAPLAGVIEPLQTAASLKGQVAELGRVLEEHAAPPAVLIGHSWGAWLSLLLTVEFPLLVSRLILVSSGPFEEKYASGINKTRLTRLDDGKRAEVLALTQILNDPSAPGKNRAFRRFGEIIARADAFESLVPEKSRSIRDQYAVYAAVWPEAAALRRNGCLLEAAKRVKCPVVAIHGDFDPHPAAGVMEPLQAVIANFRFIILAHCGHSPWRERAVRDAFFALLIKECGLAEDDI